jgi:hypothetical protein
MYDVSFLSRLSIISLILELADLLLYPSLKELKVDEGVKLCCDSEELKILLF